MKVTIDCETCGAEGGIWKGGTIPVACPAECDNGQVTLEGDEATDELERREVARRRFEQRAGVARLAAEGRSGSLARPAIAALDLDPFAVGVEVSRSSRKARTNAHPGAVAAFAHLAAEPGRARQTSVGGWAK